MNRKIRNKRVCIVIFFGVFLGVILDFKLSSFLLKTTFDESSSKFSAKEEQRTATGGNKEQLSATGGNKEQRTATGGDKDQRTATGGDNDQRTATGGDKEQRTATGGDKEQRTATGGDKEQRTATGGDKGFVHDDDKLFLEPAVHTDFPSADGQQPKIPHIIHQTYKDTNVPNQAEPFIRSFINHNPNWTYYFWTDDNANKLITDKYHFFLQVWDTYKHYMHRADAMRYFVLHHFGGVYADLDMECLRPLDHVTRKFSCIFPPEPFPNSVFGVGRPYLINNAIMLCKQGHPFLEYMMHDLEKTATRKKILAVAGPAFVTDEYGKYMKVMGKIMKDSKTSTNKLSTTEPYFYQALKLPTEIDDRLVYVPNTHYFMNTFSPVHKMHENIAACAYWDEGMNITQCHQHNNNSSTCDRWIKPPVPSKDACKTKKFIYCVKPNDLQKKACHELARNDMQLKDQFRYTFTKHNYFNSYYNQKKYNETISIFDIAPHVHVYNSSTTV